MVLNHLRPSWGDPPSNIRKSEDFVLFQVFSKWATIGSFETAGMWHLGGHPFQPSGHRVTFSLTGPQKRVIFSQNCEGMGIFLSEKFQFGCLFFLNTTGQKTTATETETRLKSHTIKHHHGSGCFLERQWQPSGWWFYGGTNCWVDFWQAIFFWKLEVKNLFPVHHPIHKFNHCRPGKFCSWPFLDRSMTL